MYVPDDFISLDTVPFKSTNTPSKVASKSPCPLAGMISKTPELVYFARINSLGMVMLASNGAPFLLNLKRESSNLLTALVV